MVGAYDPSNGALIWRVDYGEGYSVIPRPILHAGQLFIGTGYDRPKVMAIRLDQATGNLTQSHVSWETQRSAPNTPSLIVVNDLLFFLSDGGILTCAEPQSGQVHWSERVGGNYSASPVSVGNHLYLTSEEGKVTVVEANKSGMRVVAQNDLEERTLASPAILNRTLLLRSAQHLWKIVTP
jgi:outer membrane protein assembly factor BamB